MSDIVINTNVSNMKKQNDYQDERITKLEDKFSLMCDNHAHDITSIRENLASIKANQRIVLYFIGLIAAALVGLWIK